MGSSVVTFRKHPVFQLHSCSLFTFIAYDYHKYRFLVKENSLHSNLISFFLSYF